MSLVARVAAILDQAGARYAVIGAAAMAVHGVARSTRDIDLLTLSAACIDGTRWERFSDSGVRVSIARGAAGDPLAGVIRFDQAGERPVDLVVGRHRWQQRLLDRAEPAVACGTRLPTALARDIVLLKLFAGGSQDAWDIEQLLAGPDRESLVADVTGDIEDLPAPCRALWRRILDRTP